MMLVILRDGTEHVYPSATFCERNVDDWGFYTERGGTWLASFPRDFVALVDAGNEKYQRRPVDPDEALAYVASHIYDYIDDKCRPDLKYIKQALKGFSARTGWPVEEDEAVAQPADTTAA